MDLEPGNAPTLHSSDSRAMRDPDRPRDSSPRKSDPIDHGVADNSGGKGAASALAQMLELEKRLQRDRFTRVALDEPERPDR